MLGKRIRLLRKEKNMTQKDLSEIISVSPSTVAMYESGRRDPDSDTLQQLADFFDVSVDYLLGRDHQRNRSTEAADFEKNIKKLPPDRQVLFHDLANWTDEDFEQLEQIYQIIKGKKKKGE